MFPDKSTSITKEERLFTINSDTKYPQIIQGEHLKKNKYIHLSRAQPLTNI